MAIVTDSCHAPGTMSPSLRYSRVLLGSLYLALAACGGRSNLAVADEGGVAPDPVAVADASGFPPDAAGFCAGNTAKAVINGREVTPVVTSRPQYLNCCDAADLVFMTAAMPTPIVFSWRVQVRSSSRLEDSFDLAALPRDVSVSIAIGCDLAKDPYCRSASQRIESGLRGSLRVEGGLGTAHETSLCLEGIDAPDAASAPVTTLKMYAPPTRIEL